MYSCYSNQCLNFRNHGFLHYFIVLILTLTQNWIIMLPDLWLNLFSCRTFPHTFFFLGIFLLLTSVAFSINQYLLNWGWSYSLLPPIFENFSHFLTFFPIVSIIFKVFHEPHYWNELKYMSRQYIYPLRTIHNWLLRCWLWWMLQ